MCHQLIWSWNHSHIHSQTDDCAFRENLGFSILAKDRTVGVGDWITILRSVDDNNRLWYTFRWKPKILLTFKRQKKTKGTKANTWSCIPESNILYQIIYYIRYKHKDKTLSYSDGTLNKNWVPEVMCLCINLFWSKYGNFQMMVISRQMVTHYKEICNHLIIIVSYWERERLRAFQCSYNILYYQNHMIILSLL